MFFKKNEELNERLDRAGSELIRAAGLSEFESEATASAPFLYARVRARIDSERQHAETSVPSIAMLSIAWRAVPALAMVAIAAVSVFWVTTPAATGGVQPAPVQSDNIKLIATGGTCALSSAGECAISSEEVLATMFREEEKAEK
ncbi:MAG: hypothetical protein AABO41_03330 [Acidobacteriota bacterium]